MHPDEMLVEMPAGWLEDWARVHRQINLGIDRDDLLWGLQRAEFLNANMGEDGSPITDPREVMPYVTEDEWYEDELDPDTVVATISTATGFDVLDGPQIPRPPLIDHLLKLAADAEGNEDLTEKLTARPGELL